MLIVQGDILKPPFKPARFDIGYTHLFVSDSSVDDVSATGDHLVGSFANSGNLFGISMLYRF